jgi:YHS domain-containing protein
MRKTLVLSLAVALGSSLAWPIARSLAQEHPVALGGYCPVAYAAMHKAVKGDPRVTSTYKGKTYLLTNAEAKQMFDAAPEKYVPAYDGWCATAVSQGMKLASDPTLFTVYKGRTYLFSSAQAKRQFDRDPAGVVAKADAAWPALARADKP